MTKNPRQASAAFGLFAVAAVLHLYDHYIFTSDNPQWMFFLWSMMPYVVCLIVLILSRGAMHVIAGATVALVFDVWMTYAVKTSTSSTAVLGYLWMPIWNLIIFVPAAMGITLLVIKLRNRRSKREAET